MPLSHYHVACLAILIQSDILTSHKIPLPKETVPKVEVLFPINQRISIAMRFFVEKASKVFISVILAPANDIVSTESGLTTVLTIRVVDKR